MLIVMMSLLINERMKEIYVGIPCCGLLAMNIINIDTKASQPSACSFLGGKKA